MKRMWDEKEIIKIAEEHGSGEGGVSKTYVDQQDQLIKTQAEHYTDEAVEGLVEANPEAAGTETLSKLKVGETVYTVGGGTGGPTIIELESEQFTLTPEQLSKVGPGTILVLGDQTWTYSCKREFETYLGDTEYYVFKNSQWLNATYDNENEINFSYNDIVIRTDDGRGQVDIHHSHTFGALRMGDGIKATKPEDWNPWAAISADVDGTSIVINSEGKLSAVGGGGGEGYLPLTGGNIDGILTINGWEGNHYLQMDTGYGSKITFDATQLYGHDTDLFRLWAFHNTVIAGNQSLTLDCPNGITFKSGEDSETLTLTQLRALLALIQ